MYQRAPACASVQMCAHGLAQGQSQTLLSRRARRAGFFTGAPALHTLIGAELPYKPWPIRDAPGGQTKPHLQP